MKEKGNELISMSVNILIFSLDKLLLFHMRRYLLLLLLLAPTFLFAQRYTVQDGLDASSLPFVRLIFDDGTARFTDIDGQFDWLEGAQHVRVKYAGYEDSTVYKSDIVGEIISLLPLSKAIEEVVILPGVNPADRIIRTVVANRKENHPLKKHSFSYTSYNRFVLDADSSTLKKVSEKVPTDSLSEEERILKRQHFFLMESASQRRFIPPAKDREEVLAYRVSGINNPIFSTVAQMMQNFHFYDDEFKLLLTTYYSPISNDALKRYYFILQDTTVNGSDTTFTLAFQPRPGKELQSLKGMLYINTNGYAIEKVIAEPTDQKGFKVKVVQEYHFIDEKKWFPTHLSTWIEMENGSAIGEDSRLVGRGNTYIKDIVIDPDEMKKTGFNNVAISTKSEAGNVSEAEWQKYRGTVLTDREQQTYVVLDSISKAENFDRKFKTLEMLLSGKIPIWKFNIPLERFLDYNIQEGYRLGLGLETNKRMSEKFVLGGYFAWGTKDKQWKYGGHATYHFYKPLGISLTARFQEDRLARGATDLKQTTWDLSQAMFINNFYIRDLEKQRLAELQFTIAPLGNLTFHAIGNYQRIGLKDNYQFAYKGEEITNFDLFETALEVRWNIRQRILVLGDYRLAQPTAFPKVTFRISKAIPGVFESTFSFVRTYLKISEDLTSKRFGDLNLTLIMNKTFGTAPLSFLNVTPGTMEKLGIVTSEALETVYPSEFFADQQVLFLTRYAFPALKTKKKIFRPQFTVHHGIGYGSMANRDRHLLSAHYPLQSMDKGVFEGGLIINGLLNISALKLGFGVFYRYGHYSSSTWSKNIMPKLALKFGF